MEFDSSEKKIGRNYYKKFLLHFCFLTIDIVKNRIMWEKNKQNK